jgi:hypothetical protein
MAAQVGLVFEGRVGNRLSSRMQAKQTTQHRSLTNNTEAPAARQPGRPLTKRELAMFLGISERFIELEVNRGRLRASEQFDITT